jgi:hypothetical protein
MSTKNLPGGKRRAARKAYNLTAICEPYGPPRPVTGTALPFKVCSMPACRRPYRLTCGLLDDAFGSYIVSGLNVNLERIKDEVVVAYSRYYQGICLEVLRDITQNHTQESRWRSRDSNRARIHVKRVSKPDQCPHVQLSFPLCLFS